MSQLFSSVSSVSPPALSLSPLSFPNSLPLPPHTSMMQNHEEKHQCILRAWCLLMSDMRSFQLKQTEQEAMSLLYSADSSRHQRNMSISLFWSVYTWHHWFVQTDSNWLHHSDSSPIFPTGIKHTKASIYMNFSQSGDSCTLSLPYSYFYCKIYLYIQ